jgi:hypothetical protein
MATDSAITELVGGKIKHVNEKGWPKLFYVPKIQAGLSYWGAIGALTSERFDKWIAKIIRAESEYATAAEFSQVIADRANAAALGKPLNNNDGVGFHLAAHVETHPGKIRPALWHIHNGHGQYSYTVTPEGACDWGDITSVSYKWDAKQRTLFEPHRDSPNPDWSLERYDEILRDGYITRNGQFFMFVVLFDRLHDAFRFLNLTPDIRIPGRPMSIGARKGMISFYMKTIIGAYKLSNLYPSVGGKTQILYIKPNGYYEFTDWK